MDLILEEKDAADWVYRGEGAANIVLAYTGSIPTLVGKVLRIQKAPVNGTHCSSGSLSFSKHERLLWKDYEDLVQSPTKEIAAQRYAQYVISPLLGSEHVDAGIQVLVSGKFLGEIERNIKSYRSDWCMKAAKGDTLSKSSLLFSDHSLFPYGKFKGNACISVEIKPKCGFLPSKYIARKNAIKRTTTRFKMHQVLKFHQQQIPNLSEYDPLDLFSGSKERIHEALKALYNNPQNNFRIFLNGSLILGGFGGVADKSTSATVEILEDVLKFVIKADDGLRTTSFLELLAETVFKSGVLDRLLDVQKLDNYDVDGAIHAYYDFISQPCLVCREFGEDERSTILHALHPNESLEIVKKFLIAATAKDCSLMFCFRQREDGGPDTSYDRVYLEPTNQVFDYKIPNLSEYDPLDLFSGSKERIHEALKALCNNPQNNFRVFLNSSLILGGFGGVADNSASAAVETLEDVLKSVIKADDGLRTSFLELLAETFFKSGVLDHLLDVQKLDNYDVDGAIHAYYDFISKLCLVCREFGEDERSTILHALPPNESLEIVKKFLIAAPAKDCSLMFCFRQREDGGSDTSYDRVYLEPTNQVFDYKVHFIDLDLKPLEKMERYYELDRKIVSTYMETLQNGLGTKNNII